MKPRMLPKIRCTVAQKMALIDYMWDHRQLARYEYDPQTAEVEWLRLAETLNQTGSVKTVDKWKVTWRDLKRKALREVQMSLESKKNASEAALKIREIMFARDNNPRGETRNSMSSSPSHSVLIHEESYQSQEFTEQEHTGETPNKDPGSPSGMDLESIECTPDFSSDSSPSISPIPRPLTKSRSNQEQINTLVDCMAINPGMAFGNQTIPKQMADWRRLRRLLNRVGPAKRTAAWQQSWRDLKRNALERNNTSTKSNTPLTRKIVDIITAYNERQSTSNPLPDGDVQIRFPPRIQHLVELNTVQIPLRSPNTGHSPPLSLGQRNADNVSPGQQDLEESDVNVVPLRQHRQRYKPKTRSTNTQILALVDYMDKHPALALAKSTAGDTQCPYVAEWRRLSHYLNRSGTAKRSTVAWKRTWRDLKKTAKKEPNNERNSHLNKRILDILGRSSEAQQGTGSNMETGDLETLSFSPEFDQLSVDQTSSEQHSSCSSSVQSDDDKSQQGATSKNIKKTRCTNAQKHALVDYMVSHIALATSRFKESLDDDPYYAEWRQLSKYLNKIGTAKSTLSWKRTWRDLKLSVLKKKWSNEPLLGLDRKILEITEIDPTDVHVGVESRKSHTILIGQEFESLPKPNHSMPTLYIQPLERTIEPDMVLCDEDRSHGDPANQGSLSHPNQSSQVSPGQQSREMSPDQRSYGTEEEDEESEPDSPVPSDNEKTQDSADNKTRRHRSTSSQINALVKYMSQHPHLAKGKCLYSNNEQDPKNDEWRRLVTHLNQINTTVPAKSVSRWKCTWRTLVINARRKDRKRSKWNDKISRQILEILNETDPTESKPEQVITPQTEDYVYLPSSSATSLTDPLKSELVEDAELEQQDRTVRVQKRRTNVRRSSNLQLRALADYMIAHPDLALNHCKLNARTPAWDRITRHLNNIGPTRSPDAWRQTWKDLKLRVIARARKKESNSSLLGFRERKILKLIGMPATSPVPESDGDEVEEYNPLPEPEDVLAPRAPSPRSVLYNLAEILARKSPNDRPENDRDRNNKASSTAETNSGVTSETNDILREMVQELKRSNELKAEQNGYLKELLTQLRYPTSTHTRHSDTDVTTNIVDSQTDANETDIQKEEMDTLDEATHSNDVHEDPCTNGIADDETPSERAIRPVALSSLTSINTAGQQYRRVKLQSIVRTEPKSFPRRLVRLKDGTMVLMPSTTKIQGKPDQDKNTDQLYMVV